MAIGDITPITPFTINLPTTATVLTTVPSNEEWTIRLIPLVCIVTDGGTAPRASLGVTANCNELCFNEYVPLPTLSSKGRKNAIGPDWVHLPPGTPIYGRATSANAVRCSIFGTRKIVS